MTAHYFARPVSTLQLVLLTTGFQVSVTFLELPRDLAKGAGTDGWMSIVLACLISTCISIAVIKVMQHSPDGTILDLLNRSMGKFAAKTAAFLFMCYYLMLSVFGIVLAGLITKLWLLPSMYIYIFALLVLLPAFQIAQHGVQVISRYAELVAIMSVWIPFVYALTLKRAHWLYLLPLLSEGIYPVLETTREMVPPLLGIVLPFFLYPHLKNKERAVAGVVAANALSCFIYLFITIACFVYFSPEEMITAVDNPSISVLKTVEFKFIERVEVPFIAFYLLVFSLSWIPSLYLMSYCSSWLFGKGTPRGHLAVMCAAIIIGLYIYRPTMLMTERTLPKLNLFGFVMEFVLPVILLVFLAVRKRLQGGNALE
ncbi:GerAB/ArcD/ProY family transporter [Paenibacillus protaetiae]|uniref:Spore gernimation protein n=1 Tax=Paenibacillus protaetiae TaxID=2509456 RepID=A0A4P6EYN6_9BACL|nr:endospore germination permease [Paenibacillus protaetiae]QAY67966.1 spore gernimation protein [Paenibacillus protaetiae]